MFWWCHHVCPYVLYISPAKGLVVGTETKNRNSYYLMLIFTSFIYLVYNRLKVVISPVSRDYVSRLSSSYITAALSHFLCVLNKVSRYLIGGGGCERTHLTPVMW